MLEGGGVIDGNGKNILFNIYIYIYIHKYIHKYIHVCVCCVCVVCVRARERVCVCCVCVCRCSEQYTPAIGLSQGCILPSQCMLRYEVRVAATNKQTNKQTNNYNCNSNDAAHAYI